MWRGEEPIRVKAKAIFWANVPTQIQSKLTDILYSTE